jgi:hypothetical protein
VIQVKCITEQPAGGHRDMCIAGLDMTGVADARFGVMHRVHDADVVTKKIPAWTRSPAAP